jgi:hypothetical protein
MVLDVSDSEQFEVPLESMLDKVFFQARSARVRSSASYEQFTDRQ